MAKEHVSSVFDIELARIRGMLLQMGGEVEQMIVDSVRALVERDCALATRTMERDAAVNALELEIDERCVQLLARRQPAARDLRFATLALKIVTDLERIGDHCAKIASHALELNREAPVKPYIDLPLLADIANNALRDALNAFVRSDTGLAAQVCHGDAQVDLLNEQLQRELLTYMMHDTATVPRAMRINAIASYLERIADHATNIAEMVIFMVEGKDIRHGDRIPSTPAAIEPHPHPVPYLEGNGMLRPE